VTVVRKAEELATVAMAGISDVSIIATISSEAAAGKVYFLFIFFLLFCFFPIRQVLPANQNKVVLTRPSYIINAVSKNLVQAINLENHASAFLTGPAQLQGRHHTTISSPSLGEA
jgi:hypothetical protein